MHGTGDGFNSQDVSSLLTLISMSTKLMIAMEDSVIMIESSKTGWKKIYESLKGSHPQCIAFDHNNPNRAYCGTLGGGLWKTNDGGETWNKMSSLNNLKSSSSWSFLQGLGLLMYAGLNQIKPGLVMCMLL